jgi:hypothetical protein
MFLHLWPWCTFWHFDIFEVSIHFRHTVKPVNNGHPWDLKKVAVWKRCLIKLRFILVVNETNLPLLTGGRYSQVVVKSGLTVFDVPRDYQCFNIFDVSIFLLFLHFQCFYIFNVSTFSMFLHFQCFYIFNVSTFSMFLHFQCFYIFNVSTFSMFLYLFI